MITLKVHFTNSLLHLKLAVRIHTPHRKWIHNCRIWNTVNIKLTHFYIQTPNVFLPKSQLTHLVHQFFFERLLHQNGCKKKLRGRTSIVLHIKLKHKLTFLCGYSKNSCSVQFVSREAEVEASVFGCHGNEINKIPAGNIPITDRNPLLRRS
jgi:hypothetical protein